MESIERMEKEPDLYTYDNYRYDKHPKKGHLNYDGY